MSRDEIEAAQVLSIFRDLLRRQRLLSAVSALELSPVFHAGVGDAPVRVAAAEFGVSDDDALVAIKNRAAKLIADKLAAYRVLLRLYFTDDQIRGIESEPEPPVRPGLSDEQKPDRQLAEETDGEGV